MITTDTHIAAIRRAVLAGFHFLHLTNADGKEVAAIHAERIQSDIAETFLFSAADQAIASRFRIDDYPHGNPLWQQHGSVEDVITALLELPLPGSPGAPTRTQRRASDLWLPNAG